MKERTENILEKVGTELKNNPPAVLNKTARKKGVHQAEKQRKAILLSKARAAGAKIPFKKGF